MTSFFFGGFVAFAVALLAFVATGRSTAAAQEAAKPEALVAELRKSWPIVGLDALTTSEFDICFLSCFTLRDSKISKRDLDALIRDVESVWKSTGDIKDVMEVSKHLPVPPKFLADEWGTSRITIRGSDQRFRFERGGLLGGRLFKEDFCYADRREVTYFPGFRESDIYQGKSTRHVYRVEDMIIIPDITEKTRITDDNPRSDYFDLTTPREHGRTDLRMSRTTKQVVWQKYYPKYGHLKDYEVQFGLAEYTGGDGSRRVFPAVEILSQLTPEGIVRSLDILVKKQVQFNHALPANAFRVSVPKDTNVFLYSGSGSIKGEQVGKARMLHDINDVLEDALPIVLAKIDREKKMDAKRTADASWLYLLLGGNLALLCLGVLAYWACRRFQGKKRGMP
jgi:hypothetical protein